MLRAFHEQYLYKEDAGWRVCRTEPILDEGVDGDWSLVGWNETGDCGEEWLGPRDFRDSSGDPGAVQDVLGDSPEDAD